MRTLTAAFSLLTSSLLLVNGTGFVQDACAQKAPAKRPAGSLIATQFAFEDARMAIRSLQNLVEKSRHERRAKDRQRFQDYAKKQLPDAKQKVKELKEELQALKATGSSEPTVRYVEARLKYYEEELKAAENELNQPAKPAAGTPKETPSEPPSPAEPAGPKPAPAPSGERRQLNEPLGETGPRTALFPNGEMQPVSSRANYAARVELQEMYGRLVLWELYRTHAYSGQGIHDNVKAAFVKHGAPADSGYIQPWSQNIGIGGSMTMHGDWDALRRAILDFENQLYYHDAVHNQEAYMNYLRQAMQVWRQDVRFKNERARALIDLMGRLGAEGEKEKPERWTELSNAASETKAQVNRKAPIDVKLYEQWLESPEDLDDFMETDAAPRKQSEPASSKALDDEDLLFLLGESEPANGKPSQGDFSKDAPVDPAGDATSRQERE